MRGISKVLLLIIFCYAITFAAYCQKDKLYLKDNGFLKGKFLDNESEVAFLIDNKDTLFIDWISILSIRLKNRNSVGPKALEQINAINNKRNYKFMYAVSAGGLFDDSGNSNSFRGSASFNVIYRIKQYLQFGVGVDIAAYDKFTALPIYFQYQGDLSHGSQQSFYYYGGIGLASAWKKEECNCNFQEVDGKRMVKAGLGYRWQVESLQLNFAIGWIQQKFKAENDYSQFERFAPTTSTIIRQSLNGMEMKVGVIF